MTDLIHPTYRHLDRPVRIAGLPLAQWAQLIAAGVGAWALARVLPFSAAYDLSIAITLTGVPVAASLAGATGTIDPWAYARALVRWRRQAAVYLPARAPHANPAGYRLTVEPAEHATPVSPSAIEDLWA